MDPLGAGRTSGGGGARTSYRPSRDDASSFFSPDRELRGRNSGDLLNSGPGISNSAGYNQGSFFYPGREEPLKGGRDEEENLSPGASSPGQPWDVYADFNNAGPKYSSTLQQSGQVDSNGYRQIRPASPLVKPEDTATSSGNVELVTVPAFGPEWGKEEMKDMTKSARREKKYESRMENFTAWKRGQRGMCGRYCTRKVFVFTLFGLIGVIGIVLGFTIPRVPGFTINNSRPLRNATGELLEEVPVRFSRAPANFSFPANADLRLDTQSNWLPLTISSLHARIFDLDTNREIGKGDLGKMTFPAKAFPRMMLPLNFTYITTNDSDTTWNAWYSACKNRALYPGGIRPSLKFRLHLEMTIAGLIGKYQTSTQVSDGECPIELSQNAA